LKGNFTQEELIVKAELEGLTILPVGQVKAESSARITFLFGEGKYIPGIFRK